MRILVTGATGFIGRHLVRTLVNRGHSIRVIVRSRVKRDATPPWLSNGDVEVFPGDVTDHASVASAARGMDVVFHLAALMGNKATERRQLFDVNVLGTRAVMNASSKANVKRVVYLSTTGVMGNLKTLPGKVNHPYNPRNDYELSKTVAEQFVRQSSEQGKVETTIVRPTHVYGPFEYNTLPIYKLMKSLRIVALPNGGSNYFQPIYVTDLVAMLVSCVEKMDESRNKIYITAGGEILTFKEFLELSATIIGIGVKIVPVPLGLLLCAAMVNEKVSEFSKLPRVLTPSRIDFFCRNHVYDVEPTRNDLNWFPKVCLKDGLTKTVEWYNSVGLL